MDGARGRRRDTGAGVVVAGPVLDPLAAAAGVVLVPAASVDVEVEVVEVGGRLVGGRGGTARR
jgi:hypothetical protein